MMTDEKYNFVKLFERSFKEHWTSPAVTDYGTNVTLTYGQLAINIEKLHILFKLCNIKKDDKIAVMGKNNSNWVAVYLATVTYGAIIVPILQDFRANDAIHIINHSGAKLLFISDINWEGIDLDQIPNVLASVSLNDWHPISLALDPKKINFEAIAAAFKAKHPEGYWAKDLHFDERGNDQIASINYTSGTTGFSKGVIMPLNGLAGNIRYALESRLTFEGARHVTFLPLAHAYGCAFDFLACLAAGGHTYLIGRTPSPKILLQAFAEIKPTIILSVPLILEKIYKKMIVPQIQKPPVSWVLKVPFLDEVVCTKIREQLIQAFGGEFKQMIIGGAPMNPEVEAFLTRIKFPMSDPVHPSAIHGGKVRDKLRDSGRNAAGPRHQILAAEGDHRLALQLRRHSVDGTVKTEFARQRAQLAEFAAPAPLHAEKSSRRIGGKLQHVLPAGGKSPDHAVVRHLKPVFQFNASPAL